MTNSRTYLLLCCSGLDNGLNLLFSNSRNLITLVITDLQKAQAFNVKYRACYTAWQTERFNAISNTALRHAI